MVTFLIKYGEISLKGKNRIKFENRLIRNITRRLSPEISSIRKTRGRIFLEISDQHEQDVAKIIESTFGVVSYAKVIQTTKSLDGITKIGKLLSTNLIKELPSTLNFQKSLSFKVESVREDKMFPLSSYNICCRIGEIIASSSDKLEVNVNSPEKIINIEVRDKIYAYYDQHSGPNGLPASISGRGLLLISGGIDSPVAGYLIGARGLSVDAIHFHSYPFTSQESQDKVKILTSILAGFFPQIALHMVPFTPVQLKIKKHAPNSESIILMRCAMMEFASRIAKKFSHDCLITGESLGQVASQTIESITVTSSFSSIPVLRPLIGLSKESIIKLAIKLKTYSTSILPYSDCCTLFTPRHPIINPKLQVIKQSYEALDISDALTNIIKNTEYELVINNS